MQFKKTILSLLVFLVASACPAQIAPINSIDSFSGALIRKIRTSESERCYLVTDRSIYLTEESIWFRAFLLRSISQRISSQSKHLFVELSNEKDSLIVLLLLDARHQQLSGKITITDSLPSGYYYLRAYTKQMVDKDSTMSFTKQIYIYNPNVLKEYSADDKKEQPITGKLITDKPELIFYPEGGAIITGANSTVAFSISDAQGHPLSVSGNLKDHRDSIVSYFSTDEFGLGKVNFYPTKYRKYSINIQWQGKDVSYSLPPFNYNAVQLGVITHSSGRTLRVLLEDSVFKTDFTTYIIGISKDSLCFASKGEGNYEVELPEGAFPRGVATLFLIDKNLKLLSERSIYIKEGGVQVVAHTDKQIYKRREKALLSISITDEEKHYIPTSVCIAVKDSAGEESQDFKKLTYRLSLDESRPNSINWYSNNSQDLNDEEVDLLMLCNKNVINHISRLPAFHLTENPDSFLVIKGKIISRKGQPLQNKIVTLFSLSSDVGFHTDTTNSDGRFSFPFAGYPDYTQFTIQIRDNKGRAEDDSAILDTSSIPVWNHFTIDKKQSLIPSSYINRYLNFFLDTFNFKRKGYLKPVIVKAIKKKELKYDKSKRVSNFSSIITADEVENGGYNTAANLLAAVPGVQMGKSLLVGSPSGSGGDPLLIIDGLEYSAATLQQFATGSGSVLLDFLNTIPCNTIDFIEVLTGSQAANYGGRGNNGVILVNTKSRIRNMNKSAALKSFTPRGYHQADLFLMREYNSRQAKETAEFDNRSTLYWNGNLLLNSGNVNLSFFTSDIPGVYKVTIAGITTFGDIIYNTSTFKVE